MDLSKVLSISGKPGLFKILAQSKGGVVVESLSDGKRLSVGQSQRVSTLGDISIYTVDGDVPLKDIFASLLTRTDSKALEVDPNDAKALRNLLLEVLPDHDQDRVYISDIRKMVKWYNTLIDKGMLTPDATTEAPDVEMVAEEVKTADTEAAPEEETK
jgi:hypothetical protein